MIDFRSQYDKFSELLQKAERLQMSQAAAANTNDDEVDAEQLQQRSTSVLQQRRGDSTNNGAHAPSQQPPMSRVWNRSDAMFANSLRSCDVHAGIPLIHACTASTGSINTAAAATATGKGCS